MSDHNVGAITMSSRYVVNTILKQVPRTAKIVVECGPGEGVTTRALLQQLSPESKLFVIETNAQFVESLKKIKDSRLVVIHGKAEDILSVLRAYHISSVDIVLTIIPFSFLSPHARTQFIKDMHSMLVSGGGLIMFNQYLPVAYNLLKNFFGTVSLVYELRNIPPCLIMSAKK